MTTWKIPNDDYLHWWCGDIPGWPLVDKENKNLNEWLDWFEEWQVWSDNNLNKGDMLLIEATALGASIQEILDEFGMNLEQFNGSCQWLFDSACRFAEWKIRATEFESARKRNLFPDMTGFAQEVGDIVCSSSLPIEPHPASDSYKAIVGAARPNKEVISKEEPPPKPKSKPKNDDGWKRVINF